MKNSELIEKLQKFPSDMEVCIFDLTKNELSADDEPSSEGIYPKFTVYEMYDKGEITSLQCEFPELQNFIALSFETED